LDLKIDPSDPLGDAPCPGCGHLLWFIREGTGDDEDFKLKGNLLRPASLDGLIDPISPLRGSRLVLDFSEVRYLSSAASGKLINLKKQVGAMRRQLVLRHVHPDLLQVFRITRLDHVFTMEL
jgi:anti-anti-sigma factor